MGYIAKTRRGTFITEKIDFEEMTVCFLVDNIRTTVPIHIDTGGRCWINTEKGFLYVEELVKNKIGLEK